MSNGGIPRTPAFRRKLTSHKVTSLRFAHFAFSTFQLTLDKNNRVAFLRRSFAFIESVHVFGHATGSITTLFDQTAARKTCVSAVVTGNPHNQRVAVTIQLGTIGAVLLCAMWIVHALMFVGPGML